MMKEPCLNLPPKTNKKLEEAMTQLERPENVIATKKNMENYEILRKNLLKLFSLNYHYLLKKKELENLKLEEGIKSGENFNGVKKLKEN